MIRLTFKESFLLGEIRRIDWTGRLEAHMIRNVIVIEKEKEKWTN